MAGPPSPSPGAGPSHSRPLQPTPATGCPHARYQQPRPATAAADLTSALHAAGFAEADAAVFFNTEVYEVYVRLNHDDTEALRSLLDLGANALAMALHPLGIQPRGGADMPDHVSLYLTPGNALRLAEHVRQAVE
ncbi:hypothetical protein [Streptomyces sp. WAC 06738]|uniref:hypothetical protein n=1 Tax=Streptomyces sp. WAC 06738 TaxID=2203210 RepID=UPI000F7A49B3|nr:hypothetical protein [Streptomyces sp. WAC 06738]